MSIQHNRLASQNSPSTAEARRATGLFSVTLAALGAVALTLSFAFQGGNVGAREPVEVAIRPETPAVLTAVAAAADDKPAPGTGTFKGVVTFKGEPPERKILVAKGDPDNKAKPEDRAICAASDLFSEELVVNEKDGGVANVIVYLRKVPEGYKAPPVPEEPVVFDQKGCHFIPHALVVRCHQKVLVKSDDDLTHNTHTYPLKNIKGFNSAIKPKDREGVPLVYEKPENVPVKVQCDFHPWMVAWHLPLDHPFMAVTDEHGKFEIKGLPPGKHTFTVWHEMPGYLNNKLAVEIKADKETEEKLSYTAAQFQGGK